MLIYKIISILHHKIFVTIKKYNIRMDYLNINSKDLKEGIEIEYNSEKLFLVEHCNPENDATFITETIEKNEGEYIDKNAKVFIKQRWEVIVLPKTVFDKPFRTHRYIESYHCLYKDIMYDQEIKDDMWKHNEIDTNELGDNFLCY